MKLTQEIKDNWLEALKSGAYTQCVGLLVDEHIDRENKIYSTEYCCIGVLGEIHPDLSNSNKSNIMFTVEDEHTDSPYEFLRQTIGEQKTQNIYSVNDNSFDSTNPDYSNVIPLIEELETT